VIHPPRVSFKPQSDERTARLLALQTKPDQLLAKKQVLNLYYPELSVGTDAQLQKKHGSKS